MIRIRKTRASVETFFKRRDLNKINFRILECRKTVISYKVPSSLIFLTNQKLKPHSSLRVAPRVFGRAVRIFYDVLLFFDFIEVFQK
ncbi:hypothetical protein LEP1GSC103_2561 [Leptospira borgpetersenii serovar Javanica str. UI 09931]|uniref:Uncharacterized protein n=1 Tax=Leptospira borgpetersenii serovar Javanica str. UI 09931 TaxID=1049767 RepID=A0AAV3JCY4_LEPBO|nr:hypothetical protein C4Q31_00275 [Leptospira borgpetersenii serovar Ceylonica]EKQ91024.1 hypothetical protein LEP1GSC101_0960 [Leptospira borgpetersenii str. UI 09149]EMN59586.1 hypothetical protein LEP1GSC090_1698 [Leptospira borgpetersenii serovar Javanica str. MK146]EPG57792.1 hypothetical protein LEP1GSC103_2561 [Leptospira borgpetersenii serovar Javanica str. UI 09931]